MVGDARTEVLRMVADKIIDVDEAERLLKALESGESKAEPPPPPPPPHRGGPHRRREGWFGGMALGDTIGAVVRAAMDDVLFDLDIDLSDHTDDYDEAPTSLDISADGRLVIQQALHMGRGDPGGTLILEPIDGETCRIEAEAGSEVRSRQSGHTTDLRWRRGRLRVLVPSTVRTVELKVLGGRLEATRLGCALEGQLMGGTARLDDLGGDLDLRVMGGAATLGLREGWGRKGRIRVLGGAATIEVPTALDAVIRARVMGGELDVDAALGAGPHHTSALGPTSMEIGEGSGELVVTTTGGRIALRRRG